MTKPQDKLWGGRFDKEADADAHTLAPLSFDRRLYREDITEASPTPRCCCQAGVLQEDEAATLVRAVADPG